MRAALKGSLESAPLLEEAMPDAKGAAPAAKRPSKQTAPAAEVRAGIESSYAESYGRYQELLDAGVAKEVARSVLPVGLYTEFYWSVNARSLMNFLSLRNAAAAQLDIRVYAEAAEHHFAGAMPVTHASFVEQGRTAP